MNGPAGKLRGKRFCSRLANCDLHAEHGLPEVPLGEPRWLIMAKLIRCRSPGMTDMT